MTEALRGLGRRPVVIALVAAFATAGIGGALTILGPWYYGLAQPPWKPPDWAFGPAWTLIFTLAALSAAWAWTAARPESRPLIVILFVANAILNITWSGLFFTLQRPDWALYEVPFLWLSILVLMVVTWPVSQRSAWVLVPYLLWVGFAAALNWAVVDLNGPFAKAT